MSIIDAEPVATEGGDAQKTFRQFVPIHYLSQGADAMRQRGFADLHSVLDQAHSKCAVSFHAVAHHVQIPRFEDPQWQRAAGKQNGIERKQRYGQRLHGPIVTRPVEVYLVIVMAISKVVSGGQTGVDRAGLDAALDAGIACGGWCPNGRRAEDGAIAERYPLLETPSGSYEQRTEWNVRDSDGTLIIYRPPLEGGTLLTRDIAEMMHKPCMTVESTAGNAVSEIRHWLQREDIGVLNVAGPRESQRPGIYEEVYEILTGVFAP